MSTPAFKPNKKRDVRIRAAALIIIVACFTVPMFILMFRHYETVLRNSRLQVSTTNTGTGFGSIWMSSGEIDLLLKYLKRDVTNYLEWGSGGSTVHFPRHVTGRYVSIEHNTAWCNEVKSRLSSMPVNSKNDHVELRCISVPRGTGGWGKYHPLEEGSYPVFKKYVDEIAVVSQTSSGASTYWDFVLIDGRDRVDAGIKTLSFIRNNTTVALHDSKRLREHYRPLQDYYDVAEEHIPDGQRGLAILKRKKEFAHFEGRPELAQKILEAKYNL